MLADHHRLLQVALLFQNHAHLGKMLAHDPAPWGQPVTDQIVMEEQDLLKAALRHEEERHKQAILDAHEDEADYQLQSQSVHCVDIFA